MIKIDVQADIRDALRYLDNVQEVIKDKATVAALNRTAKHVEGVAVRQISKEANLPQKEIRKRLLIRKANRVGLTAEISALPWSPNLIRYGARETKLGVSAAPWRKRRVHKGTFIGNQGRTVFVRTTKERLPIKPVRGPSVRKEFLRDAALKAMEKAIDERFPREFESALKFYMRTKR